MSCHEDDEQVVETVSRAGRERLRRTGRAHEGTSGGAIYVDRADGSPAVITRFLGSMQHACRTAEALALAATRGLPVPTYWRPVDLGADVLIVQERLAGSPPSAVTPAVIDAVVAVNDRFAHVLDGVDQVPVLPLHLLVSGDPFPRHDVLAEHSPRSRRILDAIRDVGYRYGGEMTADDLLHVDLDLSNVLVDGSGTITGVVDWNLGAYRGDRLLALVKTRFEQEWALREPAVDPQLVEAAHHLDRILRDRVSTGDLRRYWAHRLLHQLHWVLRSQNQETVDWHLDVAEERLL